MSYSVLSTMEVSLPPATAATRKCFWQLPPGPYFPPWLCGQPKENSNPTSSFPFGFRVCKWRQVSIPPDVFCLCQTSLSQALKECMPPFLFLQQGKPAPSKERRWQISYICLQNIRDRWLFFFFLSFLKKPNPLKTTLRNDNVEQIVQDVKIFYVTFPLMLEGICLFSQGCLLIYYTWHL